MVRLQGALLVHQRQGRKVPNVYGGEPTLTLGAKWEQGGNSFPQSPRKSSSSIRWLLALRCLCAWPQCMHLAFTQAEQSFPSEDLPSEFPAQSWLRPFPKLHLGPLSFLCQQLSPSTQPERGLFSERPARWPRRLRVSH